MKNLLPFCLMIVLFCTSYTKKNLPPTQTSQYFVGSWVVGSPILVSVSKTKLIPTFLFSQDGSLRLGFNGQSFDPLKRRWQYNNATKELMWSSSQGQHVLIVKEANATQFIAQMKDAKTLLTFRRKN